MRFQILVPGIYEIPDEDIARVVKRFRENWAPIKPPLYIADIVRCAVSMNIGHHEIDDDDVSSCDSNDPDLLDEDYPE